MAIGAITVINKTQVPGPLNLDQISFAGDGAYVAGGTVGFQALARAAINKGNITIISVQCKDSGVYNASYDAATDKLKIFDGAGVEAANGSLAATTFKLVVTSK